MYFDAAGTLRCAGRLCHTLSQVTGGGGGGGSGEERRGSGGAKSRDETKGKGGGCALVTICDVAKCWATA
eukprot:301025-Hanusia_phi.AAC.1